MASSESSTAARQFFENLQAYGSNPTKNIEQYNLYAGLLNLAKAIGHIEERLDRIDQICRNLESRPIR